ncbi:MAG: AlpA family phage regulatory protein [Devosia sp.]|uniref:helix-turn-helix transcriptional regulator n=1 Tax=Devosia sp. 66-22 TaxID=1895753 RepID=UPI00092750E9|nr:AlpA family phage regulatory protein [Devosia sp. 66-22]MBN9345894.1 AlpA family phage regulatory protein [Devosia sp.]OJX49716.1 MAG: hypothetical protein BGO81_19300 [Devosia sp. 66-22]
MATSFLRREEVQRRLGVGRTKLVSMVESGEFPKPIKVSGGVLAWPDTDVQGFIDSRIAAERG